MDPKLSELFDLSKIRDEVLFEDCEYPWEVIAKLSQYIGKIVRGENHGSIPHNAFIERNVDIGQGTVVEPGAVILGPTVIGENCHIRAHAYIRGNVLIGDNAVVGHCTEVKNALILDFARMDHFNYIADSIVGFRAHLGAGAILANTKTPRGEVVVRGEDKKYQTGLEKFGSAVGDGAEIGCNAVLNPGSVIGKNAIVYPLVSWRGILASKMIAKDAKQIISKA